MAFDHHWLAPDLATLPTLLGSWRRSHPRLGVLALLPEALAHAVPALQAHCRTAGVTLLGAVFPALLDPNGPATDRVLLIRLDSLPPHFLVEGLDTDVQTAAQRITEAAGSVLTDAVAARQTVFWVFDGILPHIASLLMAITSPLHEQLHCLGVNAGSERFVSTPCLFDGLRFVANGALALVLPDLERHAVAHSYPTSQTLMRATSTTGNRIDRIDGRPALEAYKAVIRTEYGVDLTPDNFYDLAVHHPFGVVTALDVLVRIPVALTNDGAMACVGEVPPGSVLRLLRAPALSDSTCVLDLTKRLGSPCETLLTFYCAGRRMHFGVDGTIAELVNLQWSTGARRLVGALTLGEIDSMVTQGLLFPQFHNASLVCLR